MHRAFKTFVVGLCTATLTLCTVSQAIACTTFRIQTDDGTWIVGRSMELGLDLESQVMLVPRGFKLTTMRPDMSAGGSWVTKLGFLGINTLGNDVATDGLNQAGLSAHALYIPGFFEYQPYPANGKNALANTDVVNWILSNFENVDQVRKALPDMVVYALDIPKMGVQPLHWAVKDASGGSIVIEYVKGQLQIHDNPVGVLTNAPNFDWHMTNLRTHINLTNINVDSLELGTVTIKPLGQGTGLLGLPGDYTPPSRFLRATALAHTVKAGATGQQGVNSAFHILNAVDIPIGVVAEKTGQTADGKPVLAYEQTQWATVYDLKNRTAHFRTYGDLSIHKIDLTRLSFDGKTIEHVPMSRQMTYQDVTPLPKRQH